MSPIKEKFTYKKQKKDNMYNPNTIYAKNIIYTNTTKGIYNIYIPI